MAKKLAQVIYRRTTMGIQASRKCNNSICCFMKISKCFKVGIQFIAKHDWRNVGPKREMAYFTIIKIVMLMCYFWTVTIVFVMTFCLSKLFYKMLISMKRLRQYCEQYRYCQRKTNYELLLFHQLQM